MKLEDIYKKIDALNEAASMNISLTGDSPQEVGELFRILGDKDINPAPAPSLGMRGDIEKSMAAIKGLDEPMGPPSDMDDLKPGMQKAPCKICGKQHIGASSCNDSVEAEDYENEPDEKYQDTKYMTKDLSGGLNKQKGSYPATAGGDNPMSLEDKIREELKAKFAEKFSEGKLDEILPAVAARAAGAVAGGVARAAGAVMSKQDEDSCKSKMKKLNASGCSKNEMYKKINAEYECGKEKFEKLYASSCGNH